MLPSCGSAITCFHAFHGGGIFCTSHSHLLLRMLCFFPFNTHGSKFLLMLSAMSDVKNTWRYSLHMLISHISAGLNSTDAVIFSIIALSFSLPCVDFQSSVTFTVDSHLSRCIEITVIQFLSRMAPELCLYDCSNTLPVQTLSIWVKSVIVRMSCPVVYWHPRCPSRYCSWSWLCTDTRWSIHIPPYLAVPNTTDLGASS
jgi:hypothetical protein